MFAVTVITLGVLIVALFALVFAMKNKGKPNKHVREILEDFQLNVPGRSKNDLKLFTAYLRTGMEDGWIKANNKDYKAVKWINENLDKSLDYVKRRDPYERPNGPSTN